MHNRLPDWSVRSALTLVLVASLASTVRDYSRHVHSEAAYYNFESSAVVLAADINRYLESGWTPEGNYGAGTVPSSRSRSAYLDSQLWRDWTSIRFLVPTTDHLLLLGDGPLPTSRPDEARLIVWPFGDRAQYLGLLPTDRVISVQADLWERGDLEKEARLLCLTYEAAFPGGTPSYIGAQFEQGIELLAYEIRADRPSIRLYWQASASPNADYTVFVHWQRGEERVAQSDSQPGQGYYPTHVWRPGDTVADDHPLPMVGTPKAGDSFLVGMYLLETMERLRVLDASGKAMADAVTLTLP